METKTTSKHKPLLCDILREKVDIFRASCLTQEFNRLADALHERAEKGFTYFMISPVDHVDRKCLVYDFEEFRFGDGAELVLDEGLELDTTVIDDVKWNVITW